MPTKKHKEATRIFERDSWTCQYCLTRYSEDYAPLHIHRRVFGSQGGKYDDKNKATCCYLCHHDHGTLKNKKLKSEKDNTEINKLIKYYKENTK